MDDRDLNRLLREWTAPDAPPGLRAPRLRRSPLRWLVSGTIPMPVPAVLLAFVLLAVWIAAPRPAPAAAPPRNGEIARYPLTGPLAGFDAVLVALHFAPGATVREHRHPGPIVGYVVDGRMRTAINHQPDQIVPAGGTFFEPLGALHTAFGSADPDVPVRGVAFLVVPTGSGLSMPAE